MKKIFTLTIALGLSLFSKAQSFAVYEAGTTTPAQAVYSLTVNSGDPTTSTDLTLKNLTASQITLKVKKYVLSTPPCAEAPDIYFCSGSTCYQPVNTVSGNLNIAANGQLPNGQGTYGLRADFDNVNSNLFATCCGTSSVLYTVYDVNNVSDSISVRIDYTVVNCAIGLVKLDTKNFQMSNAQPNPSNTVTSIKYDFNFNPNTASIKVYNMLGAQIKELKLTGNEGKANLDVSSLSDGLYFYSLIINDKIVTTKKLVVEH